MLKRILPVVILAVAAVAQGQATYQSIQINGSGTDLKNALQFTNQNAKECWDTDCLQDVAGVLQFKGSALAGSGGGATTGDALYYVSTTGNDTNACTSTGAAACLTVAGALGKVPKTIRHNITISIGAGTFAGVTLSGLTFDQGFQPAGASLMFVGTASAASPTTGVTSGTIATATIGAWTDGTTNKITVTSASWTAHDAALKGQFLKFTSGALSGTLFPIVDVVDATHIQYTGSDDTGAFSSGPSNGDTFSLIKVATILGDANSSYVMGLMDTGTAGQNVTFKNIDFHPTSAFTGVQMNGHNNAAFINCRFSTTGNADGIYATSLNDIWVEESSFSTNGYGVFIADFDSGEGGFAAVHSQNNFFHSVLAGANAGSGIGGGDARIDLVSVGDMFIDQQAALVLDQGNVAIYEDYFGNAIAAIGMGDSSAFNGRSIVQGGEVSGDKLYFNGTGAAINCQARGVIKTDHTGGTGNTNGATINNGCLYQITANTSFGTVGGNEIALDTANYSLATLRGASPTMEVDAKWGSRVVQ